MRVHLILQSPQGRLSLPRQYNEQIQGFIYRHLDAHLAVQIHDEGHPDPKGKRRLKLFTFSRLQGKWRMEGEKIVFSGSVQLVVASPMNDFLESLVTHLMRQRTLQLGEQPLVLQGIEVEPPVVPQCPVLVQALSPITVYSTFKTAEGRCKTHYWSPWEPEFEQLLLQNLVRKVRVWYGREVSLEGCIRPFKVSPRDEHVVKFKGTVIKGWTGIYELDLPPELWDMAYHAGLGAKNSQGFGCLGLWEPKPFTGLFGSRRKGRKCERMKGTESIQGMTKRKGSIGLRRSKDVTC